MEFIELMYGVPGLLLQALWCLYNCYVSCVCCVCILSSNSDWASPGLSLVTNSICDLHGQDLKHCQREERAQFGDLRIASLLFADDVVLLVLTHYDL